MSWLFNPEGVQQPRTAEQDNTPKVKDYSGREVSTKSANQPFLSYTNFRNKQKEEHEAWLKRKAEREEKIKKGEKVGPEEKDPTAVEEVGLLGLLKFLTILLIFVVLAGKFVTGSFLWNYEDQLPKLKNLLPTNDRLYSEEGLMKFDGSDPKKPILLAIDGDVYDVSEGKRTYGPEGSYHFMAGRDAARAFATGCFGTHRTHDIRGLSEREMKSLTHWKNFFKNHKKYNRVGRVQHRTIDPSSPIPEPCNPEQGTHEQKKEQQPKPVDKTKHEEL